MAGYVYVLKSERNGRYYVGSTDNLMRRCSQHVSGQCHTTVRMLPVKPVGWQEFGTLSEARRVERALKSRKSRVYIEQWLKSNQKPT